jgi:hypothetical protein
MKIKFKNSSSPSSSPSGLASPSSDFMYQASGLLPYINNFRKYSSVRHII